MRDPQRIPVILERLQKVWSVYPDLRLGQLISAAMTDPDQLFYISDEQLISNLEKLLAEEEPHKPEPIHYENGVPQL